MNTSTQILPDGYVQSAEINLKKDKRLTILLNIGAFIVFILMFYLLTGFTALVRPDITNFSETITIEKMLSALGLTVIVLIIYEIIHGLFFWIFSHGRPVFALRPLYAYAGAPTWFFSKRQYAITALAPLVIIGVVGLLLIMLAQVSWLLMIAFLVALNTGGAMGDLFVFIRLLKLSSICYVNDTGDLVTFFELRATAL